MNCPPVSMSLSTPVPRLDLTLIDLRVLFSAFVAAKSQSRPLVRNSLWRCFPPLDSMNCSAQACMDVCDLACSSAVGCSGGALVDEDINHFASDKGMNALKAVHITTATLSVLGSLFIMVTYHLIPTHRGASLRIVYWLSVSDLVTSLVYIVDGFTSANEDGSPRCSALPALQCTVRVQPCAAPRDAPASAPTRCALCHSARSVLCNCPGAPTGCACCLRRPRSSSASPPSCGTREINGDGSR